MKTESEITVIMISSDSSSNKMNPRSIYPNLAPKAHRRRRSSSGNPSTKKRMRIESPPVKKQSSGSSIEEITKESFEDVTLGGGTVKKSSSWIKLGFLGKGSFGSVYLGTSKKERDFALAAIKSAEISKASSLIDEHRILARLSSPFVVGCLGYEMAREKTLLGGGERTNYNLILEYCSGKSLADLIKTKGVGLHENDVKVFLGDILFGLYDIHRANIIHCDIKPDNILLTPVDKRFRDNGYLTKIADFGLAMEKGSIEYGDGSGHLRGTTRYMAPELFRYGTTDYSVDIWALGCTVLEMLTGQVAWGEYSALASVHWENLIGHSGFIPYIPDWLSVEAKDFLRRCLVREPGSRWSIGALMKHPFLVRDFFCF